MRIGITTALIATFALFLASCQQGPQQPQGPLLQSSLGTVGLGRVPVGAVSQARMVTFKLDSAGTNAQVFYPANPFAGPNAREFLIGPGLLVARPISDVNTLRVNLGCRPQGLGRRQATFAPSVVGAQADPKSVPVTVRCTGIGKTRNTPGATMKIYNGNLNDALDFGQVPVGQSVRRTVRIVNRTNNTYDIRIGWVLGPRSTRAGVALPAGAGIKMAANPAPFTNPPTQIRPGQTITVQIDFKPHEADTYDASLEVQYDLPGTRNQTQLLYTYVTGEGVGG